MNYRIKPKSKAGHQYSAEEVAEAMRKFVKDRGLIKKLPDEIVLVNRLVNLRGFRNASGYEGGEISDMENFSE